MIDDVRRSVTMDLKEAGGALVLVSLTRDELGASHLYLTRGDLGANVPVVDAATNAAAFRALHEAIQAGRVRACHDLSEGGLAAAAAEMAFAGGLGARIDADAVPAEGDLPVWKRLFSESHGRFLIETGEAERLLEAFGSAGVPAAVIGAVTDDARLVVTGGGRTAIDAPLAELKEAWQAPLRL